MTKKKDLDIRPQFFFKNYDYAGPEDGDGIGPGKGLYNGRMDKYKSTKEFIEKSRERRKKALSVFAAVLDLSQRLKEKKEQEEIEKTKKQLAEAVPPEPGEASEIDELARAREARFLSEVESAEKGGVWMHRFSDVRKDSVGFYILKSDNPAGKKMKVGDFLSDYAVNLTPYWQVSLVESDRINLKPIPPNPFVTGIGAGGAKLTDYDVSVFTGKAEKERVERIKNMLNAGNAQIDDVKYILDGTVPVQMGPNGAQGGWYNINDRANRGGNKGKSSTQIMIDDAKRLKELGFPVPTKALDGTLDTSVWNSWIEGNGNISNAYIPKNVESYVDFHKKMTEKGKYRYDEQALSKLKRESSKEGLEEYWDQAISDFVSMPKEEFKNKYPYIYSDTLKDLIYSKEKDIREFENRKAYLSNIITDIEDESVESVIKNVFNPERRIAIKNTETLIEMCKEDSSYIKYLHDMIRLGGSDWYANEKVINFFALIDDVDGLKLAAETLKDPTNQRYAFDGLINRGESTYVMDRIEKMPDIDFEALGAVLHSLKDKMPDDSGYNMRSVKRNNYVIDFLKRHNLVDKIDEIANGQDVTKRHHAHELAITLMNSFGTNLGWKPGDSEIVDRLADLTKKLEKYER